MKLVIFDIDGTLADTKEVEDRCFRAAFWETLGIDLAQQNWADLKHVTDWGITEEVVEREQGRRLEEGEYTRLIDAFVELLQGELSRDRAQFSEVAGSRTFFELLQGRGDIGVGIATGSWLRSAEVKLGAIGINPEGVPFGHSDLHKSREDITLAAISQCKALHGAEVEGIVYFGDGEWDWKATRNLGIGFVGIDCDGSGKLQRLGAEHVFADFREVDRLLEIIGAVG